MRYSRPAFLIFEDRVSVQDSPESFYHICPLAIQRQSLDKKKRPSSTYLTECINSNQNTYEETSNAITKALFAKAGRRYGVNNWQPI